MHAIFAWFWVLLTKTTYSPVSGFEFSVLPFGANPNDKTDDSVAIQWAIDTVIKNGSNNIIVFPAGTYDIILPLDLSSSINLTVMGQGIRETLLLGQSQRSIFTADVALGLIITSLSIDFNPLPFTAGYVINVDASFIDVRVVPPHQAGADRQVGALLRYDLAAMRSAFGPRTYEIYQTPPSDRNTSIIEENVLWIPLASPSIYCWRSRRSPLCQPIPCYFRHQCHRSDCAIRYNIRLVVHGFGYDTNYASECAGLSRDTQTGPMDEYQCRLYALHRQSGVDSSL